MLGLFKRLSHNTFNYAHNYRYMWQPYSLLSSAASRAMIHSRNFSSNEVTNENEALELVEAKVFEVIKSAAKCDHSKLNRQASFEELGKGASLT